MAQTTEKVYSIQVEGVDSFNELRQAIEQLNDKLKTLNTTSQEYKDTLAQLTEYQTKLSDAMQGISTSAEKTDASLTNIKDTVDSVTESITTLGEDVINSFVDGFAQGMAEAAANTEQMSSSMDKSVNSVKGLKQEISDLRDRLVTLDKGSDEYKATVQELVDAQVKLKEVMNAGKNEVQAAEGSYNALSQRMSALKQVWKEATDEATRDEIGKQIAEINAQLKGMDASIGNFQRNVGNYQSALDGLDGSFVKWKQELRECKEALEQLDPSTQEYADTMARASELTHLMADQQEMIKYSSADLGDQLNNIRGIASNLAAGYSAVNAAMGLFGQENEEVQQAMLKVQQAMALVQGLQGIDGFIKRTKGLSQSLGLVTKATQANTVATKANATASKQDAVAKGAEAAATAGAVPAQLSLNAAMEANPIGFIIGLIAALVTGIMLLKDKIMEMIGANEEMSAAFDKVKAVLAGVGNIIKKSVINPIKMAIIPIKTLAKVMIDLFKGDWAKIGDDIKDGFEEMKDTAIDTINVVGAFKEGYDKKTAEQEEAARKKRAEERSKELDDIIKDNKAKAGSDWKYTEEGKKAYEEYFAALEAMYDKDSDEWKQVQRDKWAYQRELTEDEQKKTEENNKKQADAQKKAADAAKKAAEENKKALDKLLSDFSSKFEKYVDGTIEAIKKAQEVTDALNKTQAIGGKTYSAFDLFIDSYKKKLSGLTSYTEDEVEQMLNIIALNIVSGATTEAWNNYTKALNIKMDNEFYYIEKKSTTLVNNLNSIFEEERLRLGIDLPEDEIRHFNDVFEQQMKVVREEAKTVQKEIDSIFPTIKKSLEDQLGLSGLTEEMVGKMIPEFQKLLDKRTELETQANRLRLQNYKDTNEAIKNDLDKQLDLMKHAYEYMVSQREELFKQDFDNAMRWQGVYDNAIRDLYDQDEYLEDSYNLQVGYYTRLRDKYIEMSNDIRLTAEQREEALRNASEMTSKMLQLQWEEETRKIKLQKALIKEWTNAVKDAASGIGSILGTIGDSWSSLIELEKTEIEQQLENGEISKEEAARRQKENEESFENLKKIQIAEAIINTLASAVGAYQSMASIPYVGPILGALASAAALAAGYAQVRQIQATTYGSTSTGGSGGGSTNFQLPNVMELEPQLQQNTTGMSDTDNLNNDGSGGGGKGETAIKAYVVESDVSASQELSRKRSQEVTF